jgi:hypothetical protein
MIKLDQTIFGWYAFNMLLTMLSLGIWPVASLFMLFIHPANFMSWILFVNILSWLVYVHYDENRANT